MLRRTTVKNLPRTASVAEGGGDEGRRIEEERRRYDKGNQRQIPPAGRHRGGGARRNGENEHQMGKVAQPTVPRGRGLPSLKPKIKREQNNTGNKENINKSTQACAALRVIARVPWPAPRVGAEGGIGRTEKNVYVVH